MRGERVTDDIVLVVQLAIDRPAAIDPRLHHDRAADGVQPVFVERRVVPREANDLIAGRVHRAVDGPHLDGVELSHEVEDAFARFRRDLELLVGAMCRSHQNGPVVMRSLILGRWFLSG